MSSTTGFAHLEVRGLLISPRRACTTHQHESVCAMMLSCLSSKDPGALRPNVTCLLVIPNPSEITPKWHFILFYLFRSYYYYTFPRHSRRGSDDYLPFPWIINGEFYNIKYELWHLLYCNIYASVTYYSPPSVCTGEISYYKQCHRSISETPRLTADIETIPQTGAVHCINTLP